MFETEKGSNNLPRFTPLKKPVDVSPTGCWLVRLDSDQDPRELEGGQFGWVVRSRQGRVGCIAGDPRAAIANEDESETRRRREGRGPGGCMLKVRIMARRC